MKQFELRLQKTYWKQGFFNIKRKQEELIGGHNESIIIDLGTKQNTVGRIDRTTQHNGTPRIMGGVPVRDWFQKYFEIGGVVNVIVINKNHIILR